MATRSSQLVEWVKKLVTFCVSVRNATSSEKISKETTEKFVSELADSFLIGAAMDIKSRFGDDLDKEDTTAVAKIVALYAPSSSGEAVAKEISSFHKTLEDNPSIKRKFFVQWAIIKRIIEHT
jgi:hypothetical protein